MRHDANLPSSTPRSSTASPAVNDETAITRVAASTMRGSMIRLYDRVQRLNVSGMAEDGEVVKGDDERDPRAQRAAVARTVEDVDAVPRCLRGSVRRYQKRSRLTLAERDLPERRIARR